MNKNYIIIGDSLTYGIGDFDNTGWATLFKKYIISKDDSKVCSNYVHIAAFPGATSTTILDKIDSIYKSFKNDEFDNVVILSIGVNDTQEYNGSFKTSIEKYQDNIKNIINYANDNNAKIIILGLGRIESMEKFFWKPGKFYSNEVISNYDSKLKEICSLNKIDYINMSDVLSKTDYQDGLHPNEVGHKKIYERVIDSLRV